MIEAEQVLDAALAEGFQVFAGVPCSHLTPLINATISSQTLKDVEVNSRLPYASFIRSRACRKLAFVRCLK